MNVIENPVHFEMLLAMDGVCFARDKTQLQIFTISKKRNFSSNRSDTFLHPLFVRAYAQSRVERKTRRGQLLLSNNKKYLN